MYISNKNCKINRNKSTSRCLRLLYWQPQITSQIHSTGPNKGREKPWLSIGNLSVIKKPVVSRLTSRVHAVKIWAAPSGKKKYRFILKYIMERQKIQNRRIPQIWSTYIPDFKTYYKSTAMNAVWYGSKYRKVEISKIDPHTHNRWMFKQGTKSTG